MTRRRAKFLSMALIILLLELASPLRAWMEEAGGAIEATAEVRTETTAEATPTPTPAPVVATFGNGTQSFFTIGNYKAPTGKPGESVTLAIPVVFRLYHRITDEALLASGRDVIDVELPTNIVADGQNYMEVPYGYVAGGYDFYQFFNTYPVAGKSDEPLIRSLEIYIDTSDPDKLPYEVGGTNLHSTIIKRESNGYINNGFAVFENLKIKSSATNGNYSIPIYAVWTDAEGVPNRKEDLGNIIVTVTGAKTSSGGGGGGGGGGAAAPLPQPKLLVERIRTVPEKPKAGDEFDIILTLRNTSETQFLQNIDFTYAADEDAVLPRNGSASGYIPRIDKNTTYDVTLPVIAMQEVPDKPIKLSLEFKFEDNKVNALSESATLILNIEQDMRVDVKEPVLPPDAPVAGESIKVTVDVVNKGRTELRNVSASVVTDNENLAPSRAHFVGNIEANASKTCELEIIPVLAGDYSAEIEITYESAKGELFTQTKTIAFYATDPEAYQAYDPYEFMPEETEPPEPALMLVMQALPWWLYAALGGIVLLLILSMGIGARRRRRREMEDDEMD